jgi:hypothetical protein
VPLSEHEQRLLEQMERALYAEDPKFASALRGSDLRGRYRRRALLGVVGVVAGLSLLPIGIAAKQVPLSVLGFLVMLVSAIWAVTSWRRVPAPGDLGNVGSATAAGSASAAAAGKSNVTRLPGRRGLGGGRRPKGAKGAKGAKGKGPKVGFMDRLEERWRRRRDQNGR